MSRALLRTAALRSLLLTVCLSASGQTTRVTVLPKVVGTFSEAMSTSFQVAPWTSATFTTHPDLLPLLDKLEPRHIRVQLIDTAIPQTAPNQWDFSALDTQLQPILSVADHSPEIQLAQAPAFLYKSKLHFVTPEFIAGFAAYAAGMVHHYNAPASPHPIHFWGILNEPNYFDISPSEYVALYNAAVPAMRAADPTIAIVALELGGDAGDEHRYLPEFVRNVAVPVDVLGVHFYPTCDQRDTDATLMKMVPEFVRQLHFIRDQLDTTPGLRPVPIWILENNVNADFVNDDEQSTCNPSHRFVADARGSSPFFPAWRAYEFSQFGKAGAAALYHWVFSGDRQYGEIGTDASEPSRPRLAYWVDLWLGRYFSSSQPAKILQIQNPEEDALEILALRQSSGDVAILLANHQVAQLADNNGAGKPRTVLLNISALGHFSRASKVQLDAATDLRNGPQETSIPPSAEIPLRLPGYGTTLLKLQ